MNYDGGKLHIDNKGFRLYGENLARLLKFVGLRRPRPLARMLLSDARKLEALSLSQPVDPWLRDNFYIIRHEVSHCAADIRRAPPILSTENGPALFELCLALVRRCDGELSCERCLQFFSGCQMVYVLPRSELALIIPMLKAAVASELCRHYLSPEPEGSGEALFCSLRLLADNDFTEMLNQIDPLEPVLSQDPQGTYPLMSQKTKNHYKAQIEKLAYQYKLPEVQIAERLLVLARSSQKGRRHLGFHLFELAKKAPPKGRVYVNFLALATILASAVIASLLSSFWVFLLTLIPVASIIKSLLDLILLKITAPSHIPRMELKDGVPPEGRTICVISALLTSPQSAAELAARLEQFRLASRDAGENLIFGLLADLPDSPTQIAPGDEAIVSSAKSAIDALNRKYGGGFFFFFRLRSYQPMDKLYMGFERKRGAIMALARLLCARETELKCLCGGRSSLVGTKFILNLDEDTVLTPGAALELIAAMLHPLNTPVLDEKRGIVISGHGLIHPRIANELAACNKSPFARLFAGQGGSDPYGCDSSELYMDLFQRGGFAGKGIINSEVLLTCMEKHIPENRVLSHDAPEGAYLRGAYMGDVELLDGFPSDFFAYYRRLHRWIRGDFQNAGYIFRRKCGLPIIERYRMLDSLRRSLLTPSCFLCFVLAFFLSSKAMTVAAIVALLALCIGLFQPLLRFLFQKAEDAKTHYHSPIISEPTLSLMQALLKLLFLPFEAFVSVSAALCALWRMLISRRHLLDWTPASALGSSVKRVWSLCLVMWFPISSALLILAFAPSIFGKTAAVTWLLSPLVALSLSRPYKKPKPLSPENQAYLLDCANKIWSYFTDFCTADRNFLPPDNFQEHLNVGAAPRSSPTNIGLCLVSCLAAADLKLENAENSFFLIEKILGTLQRLPKWNGHLYNWYDIRSLAPMSPAFISTVDSGNLAACLLILHAGLLEHGKPELAKTCHALYENMDFAPLYHKERQLLSTGYNLEKMLLAESCYDMLASEARTASYIAIAKGDLPRNHYKKLSRGRIKSGNYAGLASWTGTMFEYQMPRLFFKSQPCSLMYESLAFCIGAQKAKTAKLGLPWGISEGAYFALSNDQNYHYKANGCQSLAIKPGMDDTLVISPYSSFLALHSGVLPVVENLKTLEALGAGCKYGFWEALDFTDGRGEIVACVMAHHLGMSLLAITNALMDDILPARLMEEPSMPAFSSLLNEKLPLNCPLTNCETGRFSGVGTRKPGKSH